MPPSEAVGSARVLTTQVRSVTVPEAVAGIVIVPWGGRGDGGGADFKAGRRAEARPFANQMRTGLDTLPPAWAWGCRFATLTETEDLVVWLVCPIAYPEEAARTEAWTGETCEWNPVGRPALASCSCISQRL